jgi:hypothetical protein
LKVRLVLPQQGGRDAIGAEVIVHAAGKIHWAVLQPAMSYLASHEPALHFGLGAVMHFDSIEVAWPDGVKETFASGAADQLLVLRKGEGK